MLTNKEGLDGDVNVEGSLGCSDHEMVMILREGSRAKNKVKHWNSEDQILASSRICSVDSHGIRPWREERIKKAG